MTIRPLALSLALALAVAPALASAQTPPDAAGGAAPAQPDPAAVATATAAFKKGTTLFQQKKYGLALAEFQTSYDTVNSPNSLLYVARCQAETGQLKDGYRTFTRVIDEAEARLAAEPKYAPTRDSARNERDELAKKIALVTVNVAGGDDTTRVTVGGAPLPRDMWGKPQPMDPGPTTVELVVGANPPVTRQLALEVGKSETVDLDTSATAAPPPPPPPTTEPPEESGGTSPLVPIGIATAGVGVAGLALFAIAGSMSNGTYGDLEDLCGGEQACPSDRQAEAADLQDSGSTQQTLANVGLIVGAVGVTAGVTMLVIGLSSDDGGTESASTQPSTSLAVGPGFTGLRGRF